MFSSINCKKKINKLHKIIKRLSLNDNTLSYMALINNKGIVNIRIKDIHFVMTEIFKQKNGCK